MLRYHKEVYFTEELKSKTINFTENLNLLNWSYSKHCLDNIKYRLADLENALIFIKGIRLYPENVFEVYQDFSNGKIIKACYRIKFNSLQDLILVISEEKIIITIYINSRNDKHYSLKKELYILA